MGQTPALVSAAVVAGVKSMLEQLAATFSWWQLRARDGLPRNTGERQDCTPLFLLYHFDLFCLLPKRAGARP